ARSKLSVRPTSRRPRWSLLVAPARGEEAPCWSRRRDFVTLLGGAAAMELAEKRVQILKDAFPDLRSAIAFWDTISGDQWDAAQTAASKLGFQLAGVQVRDPPYDYERALAQSAPGHRGSLIVMVSPFFFRDRARLAEFALRHRIVSMFGFREWARSSAARQPRGRSRHARSSVSGCGGSACSWAQLKPIPRRPAESLSSSEGCKRKG